MDAEKEQSIINKLEAIKTDTNETSELRIRKFKSLINQMNLRLLENQDEKEKILSLQKLGYEAILYVLDNDTEIQQSDRQQQKDKTNRIIEIIESEIKSL